jgi:uncharacterized membrane protein YccF (DUF307 family)
MYESWSRIRADLIAPLSASCWKLEKLSFWPVGLG